MFGFDPRQVFRGNPEIAVQGKNRMMADQQRQMDARREAFVGEGPREVPRWAQVVGAVGAGLRDLGHSTGDGNLDRFSQAQQRMRQARQEHDQRRRRFEQLSRNISPSDTQFWNAFALGGEESAMQVLQSRSEREYDSAVRKDDRSFRRGMAEEDRSFRRSEGAADRATRLEAARMGAEADTAVIRNARAAAGLGPNDPLTEDAIGYIRQQISRGEVRDPMEIMMLQNMGLLGENEARQLLGLGGGDEIDALMAAGEQ